MIYVRAKIIFLASSVFLAWNPAISAAPDTLATEEAASEDGSRRELSQIHASLREMALRLNTLQVEQRQLALQLNEGIEQRGQEIRGLQGASDSRPISTEEISLPPVLVWGIGSFVAAILIAVALCVYYSRRAASMQQGSRDAIRENLGELGGRLDAATAAFREAAEQTEMVSEAQRVEDVPEPAPPADDVLHPLAFPLATELIRMRVRLGKLPLEDRTLTPLRKALDRLESVLMDHGYEVVDYTGQPYNDGMNLKASFVPSEELNPNDRVITRVIRPQINFKGVSVHPAEVEVSIGQDA